MPKIHTEVHMYTYSYVLKALDTNNVYKFYK